MSTPRVNEAAERLRASMAGTSQTTADGITWFDPAKELDAALAAERADVLGAIEAELNAKLSKPPHPVYRWTFMEAELRLLLTRLRR